MIDVKFELPDFSIGEAENIAQKLFGISVSGNRLPGERDLNFHLQSENGNQFVLKIANATEAREVLELQNSAMAHLAKHTPDLQIPRVCQATSGEEILTVKDDKGNAHYVRLLTFIPARMFASVKPHSIELLESLGKGLGKIDGALESFNHPSAQRELKWDLSRAFWIRDYLQYIQEPERRTLIEKFLNQYEISVLPLLAGLRKSVIYNDANDYNILVDASPRVIGVIDFGDMLYGRTIFDLAVAIAYAMLGKPDPVTAAAHVIRGYHETFPLKEEELRALFLLACTRLCLTVTNAAYQKHAEPGNTYLTISEEPAWHLLHKLAAVNPELAHFRFRFACGFPATPNSSEVVRWLKKNSKPTGPLIKADLAYSHVFDMSVGSTELGGFEEMFARLSSRSTEVVIGRYNETRVLTPEDAFQIQGNDGLESRTVHLGIDLFTQPGSEVYVPLDGIVHSFRNNAARYDYGPTIILEHAIEEVSLKFFTLYGHLSIDSLKGLKEGMFFEKGARIGRIGNSDENGGWPPHLHFQIISDMIGLKGDFPGNALPSQRSFWLDLCPDPDLILQRSFESIHSNEINDDDQLLSGREKVIGPSLSLSYRKPLHIVRGYRQYLYDSDGRAYLDCVNNVAHVGHCHPQVLKAGQEQMAVLNTNTRYLHENIVRYAQRLCATLPERLSVCYFVNSGSEANELALRLARAYTQSTEIFVLESAYHGNTSGLIDVSPYKFDGPGGQSSPAHVHTLPLPDLYRGLYRRNDLQASQKYVQHVADTIQALRKQGKRLGAFLCESMPGVAGQIILPEGYLQTVYDLVRDAGGVCIADEVQTGFGRPGTHFWAFQTQEVVPDIVTLGKPIGNGHPLGAVITTREIAAAFSDGMEYFNTFGGNPVSCAIGLAVLDVIAEEKLQQNALEIGSYLKARLLDLMMKYPLIGDVRGCGLFLGIELVLNRDNLAPAHEQADYLINRMKDRAILLSTDGALHNVLKIKPPLVFTRKNADLLLSTLQEVLEEDACRSVHN